MHNSTLMSTLILHDGNFWFSNLQIIYLYSSTLTSTIGNFPFWTWNAFIAAEWLSLLHLLAITRATVLITQRNGLYLGYSQKKRKFSFWRMYYNPSKFSIKHNIHAMYSCVFPEHGERHYRIFYESNRRYTSLHRSHVICQDLTLLTNGL